MATVILLSQTTTKPILLLKLMPLMTPQSYHCPSYLLFFPNVYPSASVGDAVSNMIFFNIRSLQYILRSLPSLASLAVLYFVYAAMETALFLLHTFTELVEQRLLRAVSVFLNHRHL